MKLAHKAPSNGDINFKYVSCAHNFETFYSLMNHRRDTHGKSKVKCQYNKPPSTCKHGPIHYWHDHSPVTKEDINEFTCKTCTVKFPSKNQLMKHRKIEHIETVPVCREIKQGKTCPYNEGCWCKHSTPTSSRKSSMHTNPMSLNIPETNKTQITEQANFWEAPKIINPGDLELIQTKMKKMMMDISQLQQTQQ